MLFRSNAALAVNGLTLIGNAGQNTITGTAFVDSINGGDGGDLYVVSSSGHHSAAEFADSGSSGVDELRFTSATAGQILTVFAGDSGLERITIGTDTAAAPVSIASTALHINAASAANGLEISGNYGSNSLVGGGYDDLLNGNRGNDTLTGGLGADRFRFDSVLSATTNVDVITDFNPGQGDRIELAVAVFSGLGPAGPLDATRFTVGTAAIGSLAQIVYNTSTGGLSYDSNGATAGGSTLFALLPTGLSGTLDASRFQLI